MDLDKSLISAVLGIDGGYWMARKLGLQDAMIHGEEAVEAWNFINNHVVEFGKVPSIDLLTARTGFRLIDYSETLQVLVSEARDRALWKRLRAFNKEIGNKLQEHEPNEALSLMRNAVKTVSNERLGNNKTGSLLSLGKDVYEYYLRMKNGERGIQTPWATMNKSTTGFWGGDLIVIVARMGIGKTFTMLMMARQAWLSGKTVLFVGTEMARLKLAMRYYCIHFKVPYGEFKEGKLDSYTEQEFVRGIDEILDKEGLYVVGDDFDASMDEIEAAVEEVEADILFVDGAYLVKNIGKDRHERVSNTVDDLKKLAKRKDIPVVASSQFNRDVGKNSKSSVDSANVGITDVFGWDADVMYGMYQTEDMADDEIMGFRPMKLREGRGKDFFSKWKFGSMDFEEMTTGDSSFKDGDFSDVPGVVADSDGFNDELF